MSDDVRIATPSQTVGPFFHGGLGTNAGGRLTDASPKGQRIQLLIKITDGDGAPVTDALVELWQAGSSPVDNGPDGANGANRAPHAFVRMATDTDGACEFQTVRPGRVPDGLGGWQASHINVCLFARGLLRQLHTRIYFAGDPALAEDAALALVPGDRRRTLVANPDAKSAGRWVFELRLQGADETVFFDA